MFFNYELLCEVDLHSFLPWARISANRIQRDTLFFVKATPKRELLDVVPSHLLLPLWFFVSQGMMTNRPKLIPFVEKWIANSGPNFIAKGYTIFTEFRDLTHEETLDVFFDFAKMPGFETCEFRGAAEAYCMKESSDSLEDTESSSEPSQIENQAVRDFGLLLIAIWWLSTVWFQHSRRVSCIIFRFLMVKFSFDDEDDWNIGYKYTLMAELTPTQLMERLKKLGVDAKRVNCKINYNGGLLHYLRLCLIACDDESKMPVNALNTLLDMLDVAAVKPVKPFLLSKLLNQLARTLNCELFNRIVPPGKEFDCYKMRCRQTEHANHIKEMIMVTGHRFMAQMNMKSFT
ncbi:unnamed protein product [Nesidiocoris tenuis]|uniref:Uncharacterized protein n=1 Tax=Nesidiocoris tenuis TaxID=355587 RepID=A0A6H5G005_9HEMI|nr:unnamed protein product [Nesidiocoris tenuis]